MHLLFSSKSSYSESEFLNTVRTKILLIVLAVHVGLLLTCGASIVVWIKL